MKSLMTIGDAAAATGLSAKMIRHYEQLGLLPETHRSDAGYRLYGERELSVLSFIQHARRLGFSIRQIGDLIGLWGQRDRSSREVKALAQQHLDELNARLVELQAMKDGLERLVDACQGDDAAACPILDGLAADSPSAPPACHATPRRTGADAPGPAPTAAPSAGKATNPAHDLMAWTRLAVRS